MCSKRASRGLEKDSGGLQGLEKGFEGGFKVKRASRQLGALQKGQRAFKGASERFEGG